ncbi:MAG: ABC transporter substrate-binding protein [Chloroflexi bacterium]|nr:ABC transporter substrate-binding protein [Chloroflexota bacterium]
MFRVSSTSISRRALLGRLAGGSVLLLAGCQSAPPATPPPAAPASPLPAAPAAASPASGSPAPAGPPAAGAAVPSPASAPSPSVGGSPAAAASPSPAASPAAASAGAAAPAASSAQARPNLPPADVVRIAWQDVGAPTPFRITVAGPGGAVLLTYLYDTLTWKDERGIIPWLAASWTISQDAREYLFTLAPNVLWHDGKPLTAEDVAFSFEYFGKTPYRWMTTGMVERAELRGTDKVLIQLRQPYAPFLEDVAGIVPIIPRHVWAAVTDPVAFDGPDASVGSGPYRLAEYRGGQGAYRLVANPAYFKGAPRVAEIQQLNVPPETRMQATLQGQLELAQSLDRAAVRLFDGNPRFRAHLTPPQSIVRLVVNTKKAPLDRVEVRQAIVHALDRAKIAEAATGGEPIVGYDGVIPPGSPWHNPKARSYAFDVSKARELLKGQAIALDLLADPPSREPDLMVPMLAAAGITLNVKRVDAKTRTDLQREGQFDLALTGHIGVAGDPDFLRRWYSGEETNDFALGTAFSDPEFDRLGKQQAATPGIEQRRPLVDRMQEIMAEQLPTIVMYHRVFIWAYDSARIAPIDTWGGLINGVPFPHNKLAFLNR